MIRTLAVIVVCLVGGFLSADAPRASLGLGITEIDKVQQQGAASLEFVLPPAWRFVHPAAGIHLSEQGDAYLYAGALAEWKMGNRWRWNLGLCAGVYHFSGGYDLGGPLEFQSRLSVERVLRGDLRIGLSVQHLSNAGFHPHNPGTERLLVTMSFPLD